MTVAGGSRPVPARLTGTQRVWLLNVAIAGAAAALYFLVVADLRPLEAPLRIPWWALAGLFAAAEMSVIHFKFRREAHSFSLGEIPLVLGLFFATLASVVLGQVVGATAALAIHRRQSPVKLAFNLTHFSLGTCVAIVTFHALVVAGDPIGPVGWAAAFGATLVADLLGAGLVTVAIAMAEGTGLRLPTLPSRWGSVWPSP